MAIVFEAIFPTIATPVQRGATVEHHDNNNPLQKEGVISFNKDAEHLEFVIDNKLHRIPAGADLLLYLEMLEMTTLNTTNIMSVQMEIENIKARMNMN